MTWTLSKYPERFSSFPVALSRVASCDMSLGPFNPTKKYCQPRRFYVRFTSVVVLFRVRFGGAMAIRSYIIYRMQETRRHTVIYSQYALNTLCSALLSICISNGRDAVINLHVYWHLCA